MPRLTEQEQQATLSYIEADKSFPENYRFLLFHEKRELELVWEDQSGENTNIVLSLQLIEQVDGPHAEKPEDTTLQMGLFATDACGSQLNAATKVRNCHLTTADALHTIISAR